MRCRHMAANHPNLAVPIPPGDLQNGQAASAWSLPKPAFLLPTPLRTLDWSRYVTLVASVVYLGPGEEMPDVGDEGRWLIIEANDGKFYGTGGSWKRSGEWVGYGSLSENDVSLDTALAAAHRWAAKYDVPTIWVQLAP